jgi:uncharacterized protein YfdQ (DUF2303 family)
MSNNLNPLAGDNTIESLKWAHELGSQILEEKTVDGEAFLVSRGPVTVTDLEEFGSAPRRTRVSQTFADPASLVAYLKRFDSETVILIGSLGARTVEATLDYDLPGSPSWREHKATLKSIVTPEWAALRKINEKWLSQTEAADFFETWNHIVVEPSAAHMAEVAMNLQGSLSGQFEAKIVRANGTATFKYVEEMETNNVKVPQKMHVAVWPFEGTPQIDVLVLVRFRIEDRKPKFQLVIQNAERIEAEALKAMFAEVEKATERTVLVAP